jgi:flagellin
MLSINTNVGSLQAAKASYSVNKSMETSMERLSTGKRINGAHDDAAGLQISMRMTAEIQGLNQSIRNAADGQSLLATAEGAMEEIQIILLRMRELAVQSANGTNAAADRTALNSEVKALESEINRITANTTWAGVSLMDGALSAGLDAVMGFQVGPDATQIITHTIPELSIGSAGIGLSTANDNITSYSLAMSYITAMDAAISAVGTEREQIGAVMNRLDHTIANLENVSMNLTLSKGRIEDADFAAESANLARTQVLQQASMAMLSQANASKQNILSLFQ